MKTNKRWGNGARVDDLVTGKKLLLAQVIDAMGEPEGRPQIVIDFIGAGKGDRVLLNWDGIGTQEMFNDPHVPQRAWLCGIVDDGIEIERLTS